MGFPFVRRSRYEALRKDLWQCQVALNKKDSELAEERNKAEEAVSDWKAVAKGWQDHAMNRKKLFDAAESKLNAIAKIIDGEADLAKLLGSESVLEGE